MALARPLPADARSLSLIRDAEIENTIGRMTAPLLQAAGIGPRAVTIRLVNDQALNAFATTEMRIFLNTGLVLRAREPSELIGVIAHEVGHLAGGHLLRLKDQMLQAQVTSLLGALAGAAVGAASGRPDVGAAVVLGSGHAATREFLSFTRAQESAADAFAMRVLDATGQSAAGLLRFFHELQGQEALLSSGQDPYLRTHPLTRVRIDALAHHVEVSPHSKAPPSPAQREAFARMQAKLNAFLLPSTRALALYPPTDASIAGRYGRAIAHYRRADLAQALPLINGLIEERPRDPYFFELKGQMLFENQRLPEAAAAYDSAARLAPTEPLILTSYAHVLLELGDPARLPEARAALEAALGIEPDNPFAWRQLATAYGKAGDTAMAAYALAEMALARNDPQEALRQASRAKQAFKPGSPQALRLEALVAEAERQKRRQDGR